MTKSAGLAIRLRRAAFNRALAEGDLDAVGPLLAQNAILVTGTESTIISGRKAQLLIWKREFSASERGVYSRVPDSIMVSPVEPGALEQGQWQCVAAATGERLASGLYSAKWRDAGGEWVIEAEFYLTLV